MTLSITLWVCYRRAKLAPPASNFSGVQFPMYSADYFCTPCYTGNAPPGSKLGIPSTFNLNSWV